MATSLKLLNFVSQRQQGKEDIHHAANASQYKVAVPQTRLRKQAAELSYKPLAHKATSNQASTKPDVSRASYRSLDNTNGHGDAFDTDAVSIDETTVLSDNTSNARARVDNRDPSDAVQDAREEPFPASHASTQVGAVQQATAVRDEDSYEGSDEEGNYEDTSDGDIVTNAISESISRRVVFDQFDRGTGGNQASFPYLKAPAMSKIITKPAYVGASETYQDNYSPPGGKHPREILLRKTVDLKQEFSDVRFPPSLSEYSNRLEPQRQRTIARDLLPRPSSEIQQGQDQLLPANQIVTSSWQQASCRSQSHDPSDTLQQQTAEPENLGTTGCVTPFAQGYYGHEQSGRQDTSHAAPEQTEVSQTGKRERQLDYSREELGQMSYQRLQDETFDCDPTKPNHQLPAALMNGSLSDRLTHLFSHYGNPEQAEKRIAFFSTLTIGQYEECGDLVIDKLTSIISKFKNARWQKRKAAEEFEAKIAERAERVTNTEKHLEKHLNRMKQNGMNLVKEGRRQNFKAEKGVT